MKKNIFIVLVIVSMILSCKNKFLLGKWSLNYDCPNSVITFKKKFEVNFSNCDENNKIYMNLNGSYKIEDGTIICNYPNYGILEYIIIYENREKKLKLLKHEPELIYYKVK